LYCPGHEQFDRVENPLRIRNSPQGGFRRYRA
jgi:hypothetical protein